MCADNKNPKSKALVTATTDGFIRFWSITSVEGGGVESSDKQKLKWKKSLKRDIDDPKLGLTSVDINEELSYLVCSWENGNFYIFLIAGMEIIFKKPQMEKVNFQMLYCIKGHDSAINSIQIIKANLPDPKKGENKSLNLIATAGENHLIHLWTEQGVKIGTFGSETTWNLRKADFKPSKDDPVENKYDIYNIEEENRKKMIEIDEKLKYLMVSKNTVENEKENDDDKVTTL